MARKKRDPVTGLPADPDTPAAAAEPSIPGVVRFPVTAPVAALLKNYQVATGKGQVEVAEELEPHLLALLNGELATLALHSNFPPAAAHSGEEISRAVRLPSLQDLSIAAATEKAKRAWQAPAE